MRWIKLNSNYLVMDIFLIIYGIVAVFPPATVLFNSTLISILCLGAWLIASLLIDRDYYKSLNNVYPVFFLIITIAFPYVFGASVIGNRYLNLNMIPMGFLIFNFYKKNHHIENLKRIALIITFFATITLLITLQALTADPYISRSIKSTGEYSSDLARRGIGGYSFIYFTAISSQFLLYISLKTRSSSVRIVTIILYILTFFFVLKSSYMTALLIVILSSVALIVVNLVHRNLEKKIIGIVVIIAMVLLLSNLNGIIDKFSDVIPKRIANIVIVNDGQSIFSSIWDEFVSDRWPTLMSSISAFIKAPLFGLVGAGQLSSYDGGVSGFGQHSYILDTFALYGVFVGLLNSYIVLRPFRHNKEYDTFLNASIFACTAIVYLLNNATPAIAMALGILYPLVGEYYSSNSLIKE